MKNPTDDDAYHALFRSYELANKRIKDLECQLALEQERNLNNVANADLQIAELQAQNARLFEAADWDTLNALSDEVEDYKKQLAAAQAEMQELVGRLTELAEDINRKAIDEDDERYLIAQRLREAISGEGEK